jgi:hypothetical protein
VENPWLKVENLLKLVGKILLKSPSYRLLRAGEGGRRLIIHAKKNLSTKKTPPRPRAWLYETDGI